LDNTKYINLLAFNYWRLAYNFKILSYHMKFTLLIISDSDKHFTSACDEYIKRLGRDLTIKIVKPAKWDSQAQTIQKDTENIIQTLENKFNGWHKVMMSIMWEQMDTFWFHQYCYAQEKVVFILGWPYGLDEGKINDFVDAKISLWSLTLPHWLAKLVLLEQIYRIETIQSGKKYHY